MDDAPRHAPLRQAITHFNAPTTREQYFDLYDEDAVFHRYPPGAERLDGAKQFYRRIWEENPEWELAMTGIEDLGNSLRVHFTFGPNVGVTTVRFESDKVVERWQGS